MIVKDLFCAWIRSSDSAVFYRTRYNVLYHCECKFGWMCGIGYDVHFIEPNAELHLEQLDSDAPFLMFLSII